jgi:hypothetical protein
MARIIVKKDNTLAERENIEKSIKRLRFEMDIAENKNGEKTRVFDQLVLICLSVMRSAAFGRKSAFMHKLAFFEHSGTCNHLITFSLATAGAIQS